MPKKGENIYKRKDGRWEGRYIKAYLPNGRAQYASIYGKTYTEAKQNLLAARIAHVQKQDKSIRHQQYKKLIEGWLSITKLRVKESTYARYVHLADAHILPYLGELTIDHFTSQVVEQHIAFLLSAGRLDGTGGLSHKTTSDILTVIKGTVDYGRCCGYVMNCYLDKLSVKKTRCRYARIK